MANKIFEQEINKILQEVEQLEASEEIKKANALPSNCYFLSDGKVLCYPRYFGDSRYPYNYDGRIMWVYSSGMLYVEESTFNIFLAAYQGQEPFFSIYSGIKTGEQYKSRSLVSINTDESDVRRFMVFTPAGAYYFTIADDLVQTVKIFMDKEKQILVSVNVQNNGENKNMLLSTYFDPFMRNELFDGFANKWHKCCTLNQNGALLSTVEYFGGADRPRHYCLFRRDVDKEINAKVSATSSRCDYVGGYSKGLRDADCLKTGEFRKCKKATAFTEKSLYADAITFDIKKGQSAVFNYVLTVTDDIKEVEEKTNTLISSDYVNKMFDGIKEHIKTTGVGDRVKVFINGLEDRITPNAINNFLANVIHQVDFSAKAKNFAGEFLGTRDIFQQIEGALMWNPEYCRGKIIQCLNFIGDDGRPPRQFSFPAFEGAKPKMDLRLFIDQGVWIISTIYTYLTFTDDYSILDEECGYFDLSKNTVEFSDKKDTVLDHIIRICDFLIAHIDPNTNCLKAMYGDWNDALDGLGRTNKKGQEYGNGVSVMASLQLYKNLNELVDIFTKLNIKQDKKEQYALTALRLKEGISKNAVQTDKEGNRKILHGWGDDQSYYVGSYNDFDGVSRDSSTTASFWVLSGAYKWDESIKRDILNTYDRLDSKYGVMTFKPGFKPEDVEVGRIGLTPLGTAENGATYIHATLFAIWSLFEMGESKRGFEQLLKALPLLHEDTSISPFVMANSYVYNEQYEMDGESISDWFTGSACVMTKVLIKSIFGIQPDLNGININPCTYFPTDKASISLTVKGKKLNVNYEKQGLASRKILINGVENGYEILNDKNVKQVKVEILD